MTPRRRPGPRGSAVASGLLGDLVEVFQPSRRHVETELERQRHDVLLPGSDAPPFHVDLEAGVAYVPASSAAGEHGEPATSRPGTASAVTSPEDAPPDGTAR
jgi:Family of unknown function (DUF6191)